MAQQNMWEECTIGLNGKKNPNETAGANRSNGTMRSKEIITGFNGTIESNETSGSSGTIVPN